MNEEIIDVYQVSYPVNGYIDYDGAIIHIPLDLTKRLEKELSYIEGAKNISTIPLLMLDIDETVWDRLRKRDEAFEDERLDYNYFVVSELKYSNGHNNIMYRNIEVREHWGIPILSGNKQSYFGVPYLWYKYPVVNRNLIVKVEGTNLEFHPTYREGKDFDTRISPIEHEFQLLTIEHGVDVPVFTISEKRWEELKTENNKWLFRNKEAKASNDQSN